MYRFWDIFIDPVLRITHPKILVEIGADFGNHTRLLLNYCVKENAVLHVIDPFPKFDVNHFEVSYRKQFIFHEGLSLNMLPLINEFDVVFIDGDHNWYTVYNELLLIEHSSKESETPFPLIFLHDVAWPYARRDLYYNPQNIPDHYRKPYKKWGIQPGNPQLDPDGGLNRHLCNSIYEGDLKNGVLTAAEDFLNQSKLPIRFFKFPGLCGLGILVHEQWIENYPAVLAYIDRFRLDENLLKYFNRIEFERIKTEVALSEKNAEYQSYKDKTKQAIKQYQEKIESQKAFSERRFQHLKNYHEERFQEQLEQNRKKQAQIAAFIKNQPQLKNTEFELEKTVKWVRYLLQKSSEMLNSKRWKMGNAIGQWTRKLLFRPQTPGIENYFFQIQKEFTLWDQKRKKIDSHKHASSETGDSPALAREEAVFSLQKSAKENVISIVVLIKNQDRHLLKLFDTFLEYNTYPNFEFIFVDHSSSDDCLEMLLVYQQRLNATLLLKSSNDSFSASNNRAALQASGEFLFFLNSDIYFQSDPIADLIEYLRNPAVGLICPLLFYPPKEDILYPTIQKENGQDHLPTIQHAGIRIFEDFDHNCFRGYNVGANEPADQIPKALEVFPAITGAAMLCRRSEFLKVGGFCESYNYGNEDVDICLKFLTQLNKVSVLAGDISLFHVEGATQVQEDTQALFDRRKVNWDVLKVRFGYGLRRSLRADRFTGDGFWTDGDPSRVSVAFAVTEANPEAKAGDYYTAMEMAHACSKAFGWHVRFLAAEQDWYDLKDVDLLVVMVDRYDLSKIHHAKPGLIKVAWMRNWFDRWSQRACFDDYDIFLGSCRQGATFIEGKGKLVHLFPIATNSDRFKPAGAAPDSQDIDICFTGHKWSAVRDIEQMLHPEKLPCGFEVYGNGWENHGTFGAFWKGFIPYEKLPEIYGSAKIVIDDTVNNITKPWGAVNSRVFDALASGALVITNSTRGAEELFQNKLPSYETSEELHKLINRYLTDDAGRNQLAAELRALVLNNHTYEKRAHELREILGTYCRRRFRFALKVPVPDQKQALHWGDYHFASALKRALVKKGHSARIDLLPDWQTPENFGDDVVIVFRGLSRYEPRADHINIMWNISHADKVGIDEYNAYDHVFVASDSYAEKLKQQITSPVSSLLQCTDTDRFFYDPKPGIPDHSVLFVGNSRKEFRPVVRDAIEADIPVSVYGLDWEDIVPPNYMSGDYLPNEELRHYYSGCKILLNDHWPSMLEDGFISNRIFDAGACGTCIVSDAARGLEDLFGDAVSVYRTKDELKPLVDSLLSDETERKRKGQKLQKLIRRDHGFSQRVETILSVVKKLDSQNHRHLPSKEQVFRLL